MTQSVKTGVVTSFSGDHAFLSNFWMDDFVWRGNEFKSGEHAFQWAKAFHTEDNYITDFTKYALSVQKAPTPSQAKYLGRSVKIDVTSWDAQKVSYMREIIHAKFSGVKGMAGNLINTGAMLLVEGNDWGDKFWGRCLDKNSGKMVGLNTLGTILMEERGYWLHSDFGDKK
jgi:ribA/ribD-fused uncharacterized protein